MNIISFVNIDCFDINSIKNKNIKKEFITILESEFNKFKSDGEVFRMDEYINNQCIYNVDAINDETIKNILSRKLEDKKEYIIDESKYSCGIKATYDDIEYIIRYIYDKEKDIHSICCNLSNPVGVLHRYFGGTYRIDYDGKDDYLEYNASYLDDNDRFITERHRYIVGENNNLTLVSNIKEYDAFKIYALEKETLSYDGKYKDFYNDGKFLMDNIINEESNVAYITDKISSFPVKLGKNVLACSGLVVYNNMDNILKLDGIITRYDTIFDEDKVAKKFRAMPLYIKEKQLIRNYNIRKSVNERVKQLSKKNS